MLALNPLAEDAKNMLARLRQRRVEAPGAPCCSLQRFGQLFFVLRPNRPAPRTFTRSTPRALSTPRASAIRGT